MEQPINAYVEAPNPPITNFETTLDGIDITSHVVNLCGVPYIRLRGLVRGMGWALEEEDNSLHISSGR